MTIFFKISFSLFVIVFLSSCDKAIESQSKKVSETSQNAETKMMAVAVHANFVMDCLDEKAPGPCDKLDKLKTECQNDNKMESCEKIISQSKK